MTMRLVLQEFLSLDGVYQGPGSPEEDRSDGFSRGGWFVPFLDESFLERARTWLSQADGLLLGRRTYESFARDWPAMNDPADLIGTKMNSLPKFVASATLRQASWDPVTILSGDTAEAVAKLKQRPGRELQIHGSGRLGQSLLQAGLIDELRLVVAPVVVGAGRHLFPASGMPARWRPLSNQVISGGLNIQIFEHAGTPEFGTFGA
jgi:dihydrofolate reductase